MTNTWKIPEGEFANRLGLQDLSGSWWGTVKSLTVEQGTRALMFENGNLVGEVPTGTYTLQSFTDRLKGMFGQQQKHVDVVLVRQEDVPLDLRIEQLPTSEYLLVDVDIRLVVQIEDVAMFAKNLLGSRQKLLLRGLKSTVSYKGTGQVSLEGQGALHAQGSVKNPTFYRQQVSAQGQGSVKGQASVELTGSSEHSYEQTASLADTVSVVISQSLRETVRRLSIESLFSPEVRDYLVVGVQEAVQSSLRRYGITCTDIQVAKIVNPEYDAQLQKTGEIVLLDLQTQQREKASEALARANLQKVQHVERANELAVLVGNADLDREEGEIALKLRRNQVQKDMRDVVMSGKFDELKSEEEFKAFLLEIDKQKLLRDDEYHELILLFNSKKEDREAARKFIVRKLELDRNAEFNQIAAAIAHAQKKETLQYEIELAKINEDEASRQWQVLAQQEIVQLDHNYQKQMVDDEQQRERNAKNLKFMRDEQWEKVLHDQKLSRQEGEIAEEQAALKVRLDRIKAEFLEEQAARDARIARIKGESDDEQKRREHAFDKEKKADDYDLQKRKDDDEAARNKDIRQDQMAAMREMMKFQQESDESRRKNELDKLNVEANRDIEMSKNDSALREESAQRERDLQEKRIQDAQASNEAMLAFAGRTVDAMAQAATGRPVSTPGTTDPNAKVICNGCRAENLPTSRFCAHCGKEL